MKKLSILFAGALAMLMTACTSEDFTTASNDTTDEVNVAFTAQLPSQIATRAWADGTTATYLTYAVYDVADATNPQLVLSQLRKAQFENLTATVNLTLVKGHTYDIVFWADAGAACPYTIDLENQTVTMDYASATSSSPAEIDANDENRDAFYCVVADFSADCTTSSTTVTLRRPFAQLNWGTSDLDADIIRQNYPVANTTFKVTFPAETLPTTFDLATGTTAKSNGSTIMTSGAVTFSATSVPALSNAFPVDGYSYVSMNYILPEISDETTVGTEDDADYAYQGGSKMTISSGTVTLGAYLASEETAYATVSVSNLPLQSNYRTNIYGALLTNPAEFDITIKPAMYCAVCNNATCSCEEESCTCCCCTDEKCTEDCTSCGTGTCSCDGCTECSDNCENCTCCASHTHTGYNVEVCCCTTVDAENPCCADECTCGTDDCSCTCCQTEEPEEEE